MSIDKPSIQKSAQRWILIGIPVLFLTGSLMHFIYRWSGNSKLVGIFTPVNESVWEHLKMAFLPTLIWWFAGYVIYIRKNGLSVTTWIMACAVALLTCPLVIVSFYYTYTGALGMESIILDIFSLFLGVSAAQGLAHHVFKYVKARRLFLYFSIAVIIIMVIAYTIFTFYPPHIPLFMDTSTGKYGI